MVYRGMVLICMKCYCRLMFWTDWGEIPKIERASMDGTNRNVIVNTQLGEPYGITIDYINQRIYWTDNNEDRIEFSDYFGNGRTVLVTAADNVVDPFALTIYGDLLYWTDWEQNAVYGTHKIHGTNPLGGFPDVVQVHTGLLVNPNGIEAVSDTRQIGMYNELLTLNSRERVFLNVSYTPMTCLYYMD